MIPLIFIGFISALIQKLGFKIINLAYIRKEKEKKVTSEKKENEQLNQEKYTNMKYYHESLKALNKELKSLKKDETNKNLISELKKSSKYL